MRTLLAASVERLNFTFLVGVLHSLVHISFSVFLYGLYTYFLSFGISLFIISLIWIQLSICVYGYFTAIPLLRFRSPFPFLNFIFASYVGNTRVFVRLVYFVASLLYVSGPQGAQYSSRRIPLIRYLQTDLIKLTEEKAQALESQLDGDILKRTLNMLRSDDDLEQFFEAIPGFCHSKIIDSKPSLHKLGQKRLADALLGFWNRTLSSNRVSESVKGRRLVICIRVIEAADLSIVVPWILHIFSGDLDGISGLVEIGHSLGILCNGNAASLARGIIARIISVKDERNKCWVTLAMDELDIAEDLLRHYLSRGDSVLLANLIHITRLFLHSPQRDSDLTQKAFIILPSVSKFDILSTLPELQHKFCALWNEIVEQKRISGANDKLFADILNKIRHLYDAPMPL